ncbi:hypothetical protein, partial [Paenibacillus lactis]|uniref:hypothetical protein n=1 Tax=Paenibacillus lactis TaxID=228574 RepID=UPI001ABFCE25
PSRRHAHRSGGLPRCGRSGRRRRSRPQERARAAEARRLRRPRRRRHRGAESAGPREPGRQREEAPPWIASSRPRSGEPADELECQSEGSGQTIFVWTGAFFSYKEASLGMEGA